LAYYSSGSLTLYERNAASFTVRASVVTTVAQNDYLVLVVSGTTITASHGVDTCSYSSSLFQTNTRFGIYSQNTLHRIDNFEVTG
jgi:hypothetical protein